MTDEERKTKIGALLKERRGYVIHGDVGGVAAVDAELARLGAEGKPKAKRASTRVKKV